jgi:hypothetical protein
LTLNVEIFGVVGGNGREQYTCDQQQQNSRAHQASHSIFLTRWSSLFKVFAGQAAALRDGVFRARNALDTRKNFR